MTDQPIAFTKGGRPLFDNTPTVVCLIAKVDNMLIVVQRGNEPGYNLLGLPGGYHMRGETWQQAGARELFEETGYVADPSYIDLVSLVTDEYGNNLIIGKLERDPEPPSADFIPPDEVLAVHLLLHNIGTDEAWAFPRHYRAAKRAVERHQP